MRLPPATSGYAKQPYGFQHVPNDSSNLSDGVCWSNKAAIRLPPALTLDVNLFNFAAIVLSTPQGQ